MPSRADKKRGRDEEEGEQSIESEKKRLAAIRAQSEKELEVRRLKYDEQLEQTVVDLAEVFKSTLRNMGASDEVYALMRTDIDRPGFTAVFIATVLRELDIDEAAYVIGRFFETLPGLPGSGECSQRAPYFHSDLASETLA
jgi:hypothetical protein